MMNLESGVYFTYSQLQSPRTQHLIISSTNQNLFPNSLATVNDMVFSLKFDPNLAKEEIQIFQGIKDQLIDINEDGIVLQQYHPKDDHIITQVKFYFYYHSNSCSRKKMIHVEDVKQAIRKKLNGVYLNDNHTIPFQFQSGVFDLRVQLVNNRYLFGKFDKQGTSIMLDKELYQDLQFIESDDSQNGSTINSNKNLTTSYSVKQKIKKMKVGGLTDQLHAIYRRVLLPRGYSPKVIKKHGIDYIKGILLHGPPGTGKTLLARQLSQILEVKPKIINGPQVLDQFLGEGQKKLRQIFEPAIKDFKEKGQNSPLHVIVIDQIDSFGRKRGNTSNVGDTMVNQLLTLIDGVDSPNNFLIIAMTNRKDLIDEALLRAGRLEVHIEVNLPTQEGRQEIFNIHLNKLKQQKDRDWNSLIKQYAKKTKNYTGAQIKALKNLAISYALEQSTQKGEDLQIQPRHFDKAIAQMTPQFGQDDKTLDALLPDKQINFGFTWQNHKENMNKFCNKVKKIRSGKKTVLIQGPRGTAKTVLAALYTKNIDFSYSKFITCQQIYKLNPQQKLAYLIKIFQDADKCSQSCIILDDIIRLIEYVPQGQKYNNAILQLFLNLLKSPSSKNRCQIIIATAQSLEILKDFGLLQQFAHHIQTNTLSNEQSLKFLTLANPNFNQNMFQPKQNRTISELIQILDQTYTIDVEY